MRTGIRRLHHVGIAVPDLAAAKAFYVSALGMQVVNSRAWEPGDQRMDLILGLENSSGERALLEGLNSRIELWFFKTPKVEPTQRQNVAGLGFSHICFEVDDLMALHLQLEQVGVVFLSQPSRGPTGTVAVYAKDPFGNYLEFFQASSALS